MRSIVTLAALTALLCAPVRVNAICVPDISKDGCDFVLEIAGYVIQRKIDSIEGKSIVKEFPDGCRAEVVFEAVYGEACRKCSPNLRLIAFIKVNRQSGTECVTNDAALTISTDLTVTQTPTTQLKITPIPDTLLVSADPPDARLVEGFLKQLADEIAETFTITVPLEGTDVFVAARPSSAPPLAASAYELGLQWVLQVYGPISAEQGPPPEVFLIGDAFTVVLSRDMVRRMAESESAAGRFPTRLNDNGLVDPDGGIKVTGVSADLDCNVLLLRWHGIRPDGRKTVVLWRMGFVTTTGGLSLDIQEVLVDEQPKPIPKDVEIINPIDVLIRSIATGGNETAVFLSPLGRVKLTTGLINPAGMIVAGRA